MKRIFAALLAASLLPQTTPSTRAEEDGVAILEEIIVEEPFDVRLQLPPESAVQILLARMRNEAEDRRTAELTVAHRDPVSRLLDLTKYSPVQLGSSEVQVDTFFLENALRPDLNPRQNDPLALSR